MAYCKKLAAPAPRCHPAIVELLMQETLKLKEFSKFVDVVEQTIPIKTNYGGSKRFTSREELIRELRIGIYRNDVTFIGRQLDDYSQYQYDPEFSFARVLNTVCNNPFNPELIKTLDNELANLALNGIFSEVLLKLAPTSEAFNWLEKNAIASKSNEFLHRLLVNQLLLRGRLTAAISCLEQGDKDLGYLTLWGTTAFFSGNPQQSIEYFSQALTAYRKMSGRRTGYFDTLEGIFFIFALIQEGSTPSLQQAKEYCTQMSKQKGHWLKDSYARLRCVVGLQQGDTSYKSTILEYHIPPFPLSHSIDVLVAALCLHWVDKNQAEKKIANLLTPLCEQAKTGEYFWLAWEAAEILAQTNQQYRKIADTLHQPGFAAPLVSLIRYQEPWELSLAALAQINQLPTAASQGKAANSSDKRLVWFIIFYGSNSYQLEPREQKTNAQGKWSKGRPIAIRRLAKTSDFDYLTLQDIKICSYIEAEYSSYSYYGGEKTYSFGEEAILALVGHPLVFWHDLPTIPVEVVSGELALFVQNQDNGISLQLSPKVVKNQKIVVVKETPTRLKVVEVTAAHHKIADLIGGKLDVPTAAKERVLAAITSIGGLLTVHSDIGGGVDNAHTVEADPQPHIHLLPAGTGLKVAVLVRPFDQDGPYFQPGEGGEMVIADIGGERYQTTRSLAEEKQLARMTIEACPTLANWESQDSEWLIGDPEACLELLLELQTLEDLAVVEWPEGEKFKIKQRVDLGAFNMRIERQRDWFEASGELQLDDNQVMDMRQLMDLLRAATVALCP